MLLFLLRSLVKGGPSRGLERWRRRSRHCSWCCCRRSRCRRRRPRSSVVVAKSRPTSSSVGRGSSWRLAPESVPSCRSRRRRSPCLCSCGGGGSSGVGRADGEHARVTTSGGGGGSDGTSSASSAPVDQARVVSSSRRRGGGCNRRRLRCCCRGQVARERRRRGGRPGVGDSGRGLLSLFFRFSMSKGAAFGSPRRLEKHTQGWLASSSRCPRPRMKIKSTEKDVLCLKTPLSNHSPPSLSK